jgi:hypothetical protein
MDNPLAWNVHQGAHGGQNYVPILPRKTVLSSDTVFLLLLPVRTSSLGQICLPRGKLSVCEEFRNDVARAILSFLKD